MEEVLVCVLVVEIKEYPHPRAMAFYLPDNSLALARGSTLATKHIAIRSDLYSHTGHVNGHLS